MFGLIKRILCFRVSQSSENPDDYLPTHQGSALLHEFSEPREVELLTRLPESTFTNLEAPISSTLNSAIAGSMHDTATNQVYPSGVRAETDSTAARHGIANDGSGGSKIPQDIYGRRRVLLP